MTVPPTEFGDGDPGQVTRIAEEFIRLREAGDVTDLDEFCGRYHESQQVQVRHECEQLLRIHRNPYPGWGKAGRSPAMTLR